MERFNEASTAMQATTPLIAPFSPMLGMPDPGAAETNPESNDLSLRWGFPGRT